MAATVALALATVPEQKLDAIYSARPIHRATVDGTLAAALDGLDPEWERRLAGRLARRARCSFYDAEEAIGHEVVLLIERRREVFLLENDRWLGLLFVRSRYRLMKSHSAPPLFSTDAIKEALGEGALGDAELCVSETPQAEQDAIGVRLPSPGEEWTRSQVLSALQRFHRYHGRGPRAGECRVANRLPSMTTIRRHFGGLEKALIAAGIPLAEPGRRRHRITAVEAARVCRSFYWRHSYWPDASDKRRDPSLPGRSAMLRCFGSTRGGEIRDVAEAILAGKEE
jgi:Homing endonuclease associated repeat